MHEVLKAPINSKSIAAESSCIKEHTYLQNSNARIQETKFVVLRVVRKISETEGRTLT
jgi:hypothetical protein